MLIVLSVAIEGLEAGHDGPATRRSAVLEHPTFFGVREVLPRAMAELGLAQITSGEGFRSRCPKTRQRDS